MKYLFVIFFAACLVSCIHIKRKPGDAQEHADNVAVSRDTSSAQINTGTTAPSELVKYAETQIGVPYLYASTNPQQGFDCSGFITYVFNHFNIAVPRSSVEFTNVAPEVSIEQSKPGDLILFTGTDSTTNIVGHMGIVISNDTIQTLFIHSSSGKENGVTITPLNDYYKSRLVKVIRVFPQNNS